VFDLKDATVGILMMMITIISLNFINFSIREKEEYSSSIASSINCCFVSAFIISYSQRDKRENYKSKQLIEEKKQMLKKILRLFPSGIIFYNENEGIFYKNKFWLDLIDNFKKYECKFWKPKMKALSEKSPDTAYKGIA
jgi:c-di-AMP phosphodiesterase-like protein